VLDSLIVAGNSFTWFRVLQDMTQNG